MKRIGIFLMVFALLFTAMPSLASEAGGDSGLAVPQGDAAPSDLVMQPPVYDEFIIGATTKLNGAFFTNMWGNNTCDIDVRSLIHGYSPVVWTMQSRFELNPQIVQDVTIGELEDGGKIYMVTLWGDLIYNDGTPITATDYLFSLMLFANPVIHELGAITTNSSHIVGYDEYLSGEVPYFSGLRIVDDYTFTVEIKSEYLPFFFELAMIDAIPYPISVIAPGCEVADDGQGVYIRNIDPTVEEPIFSVETLTETILDPETGYLSHPYVSCGPYKLTEFDWDTRVARFNINPYYKGYYDGQKPTIDNLVFRSVLPETMMEEYWNGEVHLLNKVVAQENISEGLEMVRLGESFYENYARMGLGFISFACEQGPFQFESVRKAVAYSFDRNEFKQVYLSDSIGYDVHGYYGVGQWMVGMLTNQLQPEIVKDDAEQARWDALTEQGLDFLEVYTTNLEKAKSLLVADGWTLNERGEAFQEGVDAVRYRRMEDGSLMGLNIRWGKMQDSLAADLLEERIVEPLTQLGFSLDITEVPFVELLEHYYRQRERTYDMMYLATNFISIFDPYYVFNMGDAYQGTQNTTGYRDPQLEALAKDLRETEQGDLVTYLEKWVKFQEYFNEVIPMLPLYSNIYFDFFVTDLYNYKPDAEMNWPVAILYASLGVPPEEAPEVGEEAPAGSVEFLD